MVMTLSMYGHMYPELSANIYRANAVRAIRITKPWGLSLRTLHTSGASYNFHDIFDIVHTFNDAFNNSTTKDKLEFTPRHLHQMRIKFNDVFKLLNQHSVSICLIMRIYAWIQELSTPRTGYINTIINQGYGPWDGLIYGDVLMIHNSGIGRIVSYQPELILKSLCVKHACRQFDHYNVSLIKPAAATSSSLRSKQVRTWYRRPGRTTTHIQRNLTDHLNFIAQYSLNI
jgi:hypothetical protein